MKTAIVYDRVNKFGGAERVLLVLHEIFPKAPLYTSVYSPQNATWAKVFPKVYTSFLNRFPFLRKNHEILSIFMPLAFESFNFDDYDLVISVSSEAAKGIITKPKTRHLCYCLTPTRYLFSGFSQYRDNPPGGLKLIPFYKNISNPFISYLKKWDQIAAGRPDVMIAISKEVQNRIKKYYHRDSKLIFPPVDVVKFRNKSDFKPKEKNYYLIVSRLEPYKKVDLAIDAFVKLKKNLVVIGIGSQLGTYKSKYKQNKNILFEGFVPDDELPGYYQNARAFIFPQEEDFGITAVEAQASGSLVIAYKKGGALDTVVDGITGVFFDKQDVESLITAIKRHERTKFDKNILWRNAKKFDCKRFKKEIVDLLEINV